MFKTYNKEKFSETFENLVNLSGELAIKAVFWTLATGFTIVKLGNAMGRYGVAAGRRDAIKIIMDDLKEDENS